MAGSTIDAKDVTLSVLANLVRLMGAELVIGSHRDDIDRFERAVRAKIGIDTPIDCPLEIADAGRARARSIVEAVLTQIRIQWQAGQRGTAYAPTEVAGTAVLH